MYAKFLDDIERGTPETWPLAVEMLASSEEVLEVALDALLRIAPDYHLRDIDYGNAFFARGPERGVIERKGPSDLHG